MSYHYLLYQVTEPIAQITLNRPQALNALTQPLWRELGQALDEAEIDERVRVVILAGAGRAFCAGYDLNEEFDPPLKTAYHWREVLAKDMAVTMKIWELSKPVIAAVQGHCLAAGCELALACDLTIAADDAQFGEPEVRYGSGPVTLLMPWIIGLKKAKELLYTGETINAHEAERLGMVNRVVPRDQLDSAAKAMARKVALVPPEVMKLTKQPLNRTYEIMGLYAALNHHIEVSSTLNSADIPEVAEFQRLIAEQGLKAALKWRESRYQ